MSYSRNIKVRDIINSEMCVTQADGEKIFLRIYESFQRNEKVVLSFSDVKFVISAFLNPALGMLYKYYDSDFLNSNLKITEITKDQREMVREVLRNAKDYWENTDRIQRNLQEAIDEDS